MKIVVFTSSFLRHRYLIDKISKKFENVIYICEKKPYIRSKETKNKKEYFRKVKIVEKKIFKKIKLKKNVKKINFIYGSLNFKKLSKINGFLKANKFLVFGSSFIKGELFSFLKRKKAINIHMGVMPYYRGTDCNFWAIYDKNFDKVGATLMLLSKKIDDGKVLSIFKMSRNIKNSFLNHSMKSCKLSIDSFVEYLINNKRYSFKKTNKLNLIRLSKKKDFDDESIKYFYKLEKKVIKKVK